MYRFNVTQRAIHKLKGYLKPVYGKYYGQRLVNKDFSIISNNCWGGVVYEWFGLEKKSPTIGSYFLQMTILNF